MNVAGLVRQLLTAGAAAVCATALALAIAIRPGAIALATAGALILATIWAAAPVLGIGRALAVAGGALLFPVLCFGVAGYPATTLLLVLVAGIVTLARHSPALALGGAVLLFEFEGSVKILLGLDDTLLPGGNRAAGAAALDLALLAAIAGILARDEFRTPRLVWASTSRLERVVFGLLGTWLALSVVQIPQGGDLERGIHGFRLFQWYSLMAVVTLTICAQPRLRSAVIHGALAIGLLVSLYAAARVLIGPADAEREFALSVQTVTMYGDAVRAVGSFSSAIGLTSFLAPMAVFALVLGLLRLRLRLLAWSVAGLALVGLIGSYSRASLLGVVLGLAFGLLLVFTASGTPIRSKLAAIALVLTLAAGTYGGLLLASSASPELRERAEGVLDPLDDESMRLRFETWERALNDAAESPLGQGLGTVGGASGSAGEDLRTTDNSFLKVLIEQGVLGLGLFLSGTLGVVIVLVRRLYRAGDEARGVGFAAVAGFATFLAVSLTGETVEQPGKVLAWGLVGAAAAYAFAAGAHATGGESA